jgi:hypothetical protein
MAGTTKRLNSKKRISKQELPQQLRLQLVRKVVDLIALLLGVMTTQPWRLLQDRREMWSAGTGTVIRNLAPVNQLVMEAALSWPATTAQRMHAHCLMPSVQIEATITAAMMRLGLLKQLPKNQRSQY